jgi:hypothetical protein
VNAHRHGKEVHADHGAPLGHRHGTVVLGPRRSPRRRCERFGPPAEPVRHAGTATANGERLQTVLRWIVDDATVERTGSETWMRVDPCLIAAAARLLEG